MGSFDLTRPDHAYLFGFLQCDGYLFAGSGLKGSLTVEPAARDRHILEEFQRIVPFYSSFEREHGRRTSAPSTLP
jgi:hypothetical protein